MSLRNDFGNRGLPLGGTPQHGVFRLALAGFFLLVLGACGPGDAPDEPSTAATESALDASPAQETVAAPEAIPRPRRIILISLDTVGSRHVGGYSDAETPNLEKIAEDGVRFDRFYAASTYTLPSHMSMLTGLDPLEHGVVNLQARLAPEVATLAGKLAEAGFDTKAVVEGGFVRAAFGFDWGFRSFGERLQRQVPTVSIWTILDWMRSEGEAPYFLFLHTYVGHTPFGGFRDIRERHPELDLPDEEEIAALKEKYNKKRRDKRRAEIPAPLMHRCTFYNITSETKADFLGCGPRIVQDGFTDIPFFDVYRDELVRAHRAAIRLGDRMVGQIRDTLVELGQLEDTLLIVTSDHGDSIFEHSVHGHDYSPYDEVIKVPLFLSYPRRIQGHQVVRGLTWHLDLLPTILSLAKVPFDTELRGADLSGVMLNEEKIPEDRAIYPVLLRPANRRPVLPMRRMVLRGDFKFIEGNELYGDPEGLLFDLKSSPDESENLRSKKPELFAELRELARGYTEGLTPGKPVHQATGARISPFPGEVQSYGIPEDLLRGLAELGYVESDEFSGGDLPGGD